MLHKARGWICGWICYDCINQRGIPAQHNAILMARAGGMIRMSARRAGSKMLLARPTESWLRQPPAAASCGIFACERTTSCQVPAPGASPPIRQKICQQPVSGTPTQIQSARTPKSKRHICVSPHSSINLSQRPLWRLMRPSRFSAYLRVEARCDVVLASPGQVISQPISERSGLVTLQSTGFIAAKIVV